MVVLTRQPSLLVGALAVICAQPFFGGVVKLPGRLGGEVGSQTVIIDEFDISEEGAKARKKAVTALLVELRAIERGLEEEQAEETKATSQRDTSCFDLHGNLALSDAGDYYETAIAALDGLKPSKDAPMKDIVL